MIFNILLTLCVASISCSSYAMSFLEKKKQPKTVYPYITSYLTVDNQTGWTIEKMQLLLMCANRAIGYGNNPGTVELELDESYFSSISTTIDVSEAITDGLWRNRDHALAKVLDKGYGFPGFYLTPDYDETKEFFIEACLFLLKNSNTTCPLQEEYKFEGAGGSKASLDLSNEDKSGKLKIVCNYLARRFER